MLSKISANLFKLVLRDNKTDCLEIGEYKFSPGYRGCILAQHHESISLYRITSKDGTQLKSLSNFLIETGVPSLSARQSAYKILSEYLIKYYPHLVCLEAL